MDICIKIKNDDELSRALHLNYKCFVYNKHIENVLTFIPDQYISDINNVGNSVIITDNMELINEAKSKNIKIAYKVNKPVMNILNYEYFILEFIPKNIRELRFFRGKIYIDNIDDLDTYNKLLDLKIDGIFTNKIDFILNIKKLMMYKK
ncbi:hypothetical protein V6M85_09995 [Sulfolobus tengchongensis]|uniref:GP-PDE domain-containing protein n=1 Tax=Sulfolobus tengchongensis TaxID=207809 RepID=A0AAX4KY48_9CREN